MISGAGVGRLSELSGGEHTGFGNDYSGWEFYKDTGDRYGSVKVGRKIYTNPVPETMTWRPDMMVCEYEIGGVNLREGSLSRQRCSSLRDNVLRASNSAFLGSQFLSP